MYSVGTGNEYLPNHSPYDHTARSDVRGCDGRPVYRAGLSDVHMVSETQVTEGVSTRGVNWVNQWLHTNFTEQIIVHFFSVFEEVWFRLFV